MVEKMEVKGQTYPKGEQKTLKKRGSGGDGNNPSVKRQRLDVMSVGYFRRVSERLNVGFTDDEERDLFVQNVLSEVKGKANLVAMDMTGSVALQKLLSLATTVQVGEVLAELGGDSGSEFKGVACDKCGGHVMESALRQTHRWTEEEGDVKRTEEEDCGILELQVQRLCEIIRENIVEFIKDTHGSHVLRTLIHVLSGCLTLQPSDNKPAKKQKNSESELRDFEIPTSFWWELKHLSECVMDHISVCATNASASATLQTLLTVCHRKRPVLCKKLNKGIVGYLTSLSSAPGVSPLLVFVKDPSCSHLIQTVFRFSHKSLLRDIYKNHLREHLMSLALHPIANYTIQTLIAASSGMRVFLKIFDELMEGFEAVLAADHMGVVVQLVESCVQWEERQEVMLQRLLQAFHCSEPSSRHTSCLPLFLTLLTYEVYYQTDPAGGDTGTQRPLSICYHGSRLVQALAGFKDRSLLMKGFHGLSSSDLLTLGTDCRGSHALQALLTSTSDKGRGKFLRKLQELYVQLACSRCGSRLLEAVWKSATISQRQSIAEELVPSESQLRSDQFARHIWAKFDLTNLKNRPDAWREVQTGESKKMKMFSEILQ